MDRQLDKWFGFLFVALVSATNLNAAEPQADIQSVLRYWEDTSEDRGRDGATVRALQSLLGPVRENDLLKRFTWQLLSPTEVQAVPRDPHERQFLPSIRVQVTETGLPQSILVGSFRQEARDLVRAEMIRIGTRESTSTENGIVRISFDSGRGVTDKTPITPRVSDVLTQWVAASKTANAVRAKFRRVDYDSATEVETRAVGTFVFAAPYSGLYHAQPDTKVTTESSRIGLDGQAYTQLPSQEMLLVWNENKLTQVDTAVQRYEVHRLPVAAKELLGGGSFDSVWQTLIAPQSSLPMVVALQEKELRANYKWSLVADDRQAIILHGTPVAGADVMLYQGAQVVIDPSTFRTRATRMLDITGTKETVHEFTFDLVSQDLAVLNGWQPDLSEFDRFDDIPGVEPAAFTEELQLELPAAPPATLPLAE